MIDSDTEASGKETIETRRRATQKKRALLQKRLSILTGMTLLVVVLLTVIINLVVPDKSFSVNENRNLAEWPKFSVQSLLDGSYTTGLQSYVSDQFFGRDGWITFKLKQDRIKGVQESNGVYLGKDGYLMEKPAEPDNSAVQKSIDAINSFAEKYNSVHMHMTVVPNAACVLSDKLPKNAPVRDQKADLANIKAHLNQQVSFTDVTSALSAHKKENIYYHTDHHWTSLGASYAFHATAGGLGIQNPPKKCDIYTVTNRFEGTMASKSGCYDYQDSIEVYIPKNSENSYYVTYEDSHKKSASLYQSAALKAKDKYTVFLGGNHPLVTIHTTNNNRKCLLLFKDSYANCFVQFLTPYYEEIILVDPRYYYENVGKIMSGENVTDVLFLYNLNTFAADTDLADVLSSAKITAK
ncbi:DHHW family protein [Caproicibacterium lactatifermentans]|uniref:DHHW protein n=1 Tax=Caproicibacterium lactatifermentans TaxID=2666138 RepID=A0ABX6PWU5_9FIRM|nr:DHHW family protein [Caproicibacterium lactatifermentans]ARP50140.1 hypothetical protein B6259_04155 [Ruminococcaceae bacterium CPB6]QKO30795.1 hypothetical protein GKP14_07170 [Caproicibacterium lactatifermentans]